MSKIDKQKVVNRLLGKRVCPKCNKKIDYLMHFSKVEACQDYNGGDDYGPMDFGNHTDDKYECPHCSKVLFEDDEDAKKFMERE